MSRQRQLARPTQAAKEVTVSHCALAALLDTVYDNCTAAELA